MWAPGRDTTSNVGFGMNSVMVLRTTSFLRPFISTNRNRFLWADGRWRVNASSVSYRWLSASKTGKSSVLVMTLLYQPRPNMETGAGHDPVVALSAARAGWSRPEPRLHETRGGVVA